MEFNTDKFSFPRFDILSKTKEDKAISLFKELPFSDPSPEYSSNTETQIQIQHSERDLGTFIQSNLKWNINLNYQRSRTWSKIHQILNTFYSRDKKVLDPLWKSICLPILLFNTTFMGNLSAQYERILEKTQRK